MPRLEVDTFVSTIRVRLNIFRISNSPRKLQLRDGARVLRAGENSIMHTFTRFVLVLGAVVLAILLFGGGPICGLSGVGALLGLVGGMIAALLGGVVAVIASIAGLAIGALAMIPLLIPVAVILAPVIFTIALIVLLVRAVARA